MAAAQLLNSKVRGQFKATRTPEDGQSNLLEVIALEYDYNDTVLQIDIKASPTEPIYLLGLSHLVLVAFAGGTPSIDIGDGTTADLYIATAAITETAAGNKASSATCGVKFTSYAKILITLSASLSAGRGLLVAEILHA